MCPGSNPGGGAENGQLPRIERSIDARLEQLVDADVADPPPYLHDLGAAPHETEAHSRWRRAANYIERYRADHNITDLDRPLGCTPHDEHELLQRVDELKLDELIAEIHDSVRSVDLGIDLW